MYIRRLHLENLKRLRELELDFTRNGSPRMWTVLIGENGTAKTTILQAIALAAAGSKQVNTLAGPIVKHMHDRRRRLPTRPRVRKDEAPLRIRADFDPTPRSVQERHLVHGLLEGVTAEVFRISSEVSLAPGSTSLDARARYVDARGAELPVERDPLDAARDIHTQLWFVAGYGVSRALPDARSTPPLDRPSIERLMPLFQTQSLLASTSFSNHFLAKDLAEGKKRGTTSLIYGRMLNEAIRIGGESLLPAIAGLELRGQGGARTAGDLIESDRFQQRMGRTTVKIAGVALSHGYQSTFAWIADLIGHVLLESRTELSTQEMEGLVLLDEIDLYLHPSWQSTFVTALRRVFPKLQFVVTTHSPVVLSDLSPGEIVRLMVEPATGDVVRAAQDPHSGELVPAGATVNNQPDPRPMTGGELYRTWFGLERLTPNPHGGTLRRYLVLAGDPSRTPDDDRELERLSLELERVGITDKMKPAKRERRS